MRVSSFSIVLDVAELERRMRPGAWSDCGFLGETESLNDVLVRDESTLSELGVTCDELAERLSLLIKAPAAGVPPLSAGLLAFLREAYPSAEEEMQAVRAMVVQRFGSLEYADSGSARVAGRYEIELTTYLGYMDCPWGDREHASTDWRIRNTARDLELRGPTLITHLISEHSFFEGPASPYRVEPRALTELLELGPFSTD